MKIIRSGDPTVIMCNPNGKANYFGWPSVARLQNGKIAVTASGYRYAHICPFGKAVISYSEDEGETYTAPAPVIDTPLDDRDAGILAYGESNVIITSFNNTVQFQRDTIGGKAGKTVQFREKYLDMVTPEDEKQYLGAEFCISRNCGVTFGRLYKSPVTSPHGPCELYDGTVLWIGRTFSANNTFTDETAIRAYKINSDGTMELIGEIPPVYDCGKRLLLCEPHAIELPDGRILCHIRAQRYESGKCVCFTTYQSESYDGGKSWSEPHRILDMLGGAPAHLMYHSSGVVVSTYGYREKPYGVKAMFSKDNGETWDAGYDVYINNVGGDLGYPCSIELKDGSILTVFYAHEQVGCPAVIMQQKWSFSDEI